MSLARPEAASQHQDDRILHSTHTDQLRFLGPAGGCQVQGVQREGCPLPVPDSPPEGKGGGDEKVVREKEERPIILTIPYDRRLPQVSSILQQHYRLLSERSPGVKECMGRAPMVAYLRLRTCW